MQSNGVRSWRVTACGLALACLVSDSLNLASAAEPTLGPGLKLTQPSVPSHLKGTLKAINDRLSRDVKPAQNAGVLLLYAMGHQVLAADLSDDYLTLLGIEKLTRDGAQLVSPEQALKDAAATTSGPEWEARMEQFEHQLAAAGFTPWKSADLPDVAKFFEANQRSLDLIVAASEQPRYYAPLLSEEDPPRLMSASGSVEKALVTVARVLQARGAGKVASGDVAGGLADIFACHRLAHLVATGSPFDVSVAKAQIIDAQACQLTAALLEANLVNGQQAAAYLRTLRELPRLPLASVSADIGERAIVHQELELMGTDSESWDGFFEADDGDAAGKSKLRPGTIAWDLARKSADEYFDRIVAALAERDHVKQEAAFAELESDEARWNAEEEKVLEAAEKGGADPAVVSRWIGRAMAVALRPNLRQRRHSDDRAALRRDLLETSLALVIYREQHGSYPPELAKLVSPDFPAVPLDAHADEPLLYERVADRHVRLGSYGRNRRSDAGQEYNDDTFIELK